jgi:peptidoglycan/xylan/chitin deacetylase (PgdA/CDA1 family)
MRLTSLLTTTFLAGAPALALSACGYELPAAHEDTAAFEEAWEESHGGKADRADNGCSGVRVPDRGPFDGKVHLTFDDGPNPVTTPKIMETLRRHNAPATFYINGSRVRDDATRAIARAIVDDPLFTLANHSWSHENMSRQDTDTAIFQIEATTEVIEAAGGEANYFRFPYGASTCGTMNLVRDRGYTSTGWHIDSADWCFASGGGFCRESTFRHVPDQFRDDMAGFVMSQVRRNNGGILLFHDIHSSTESALEGILNSLEAESYEYTRVQDENTFPLLNGVEQKFIGDACEVDADCNFPGAFCMPEPTGGYCTSECSGTCPDRSGFATTRCVTPPVGVATGFQVCALSCIASDCREGLSCETAQGSNGQNRSVCF